MKKMMKQYAPPRILKKVEVRLEQHFLDGTLTGGAQMETTGQKVEEHHFDESGFNFTWE